MGKRSPKKDDGKMDESTRKQLEDVKAEERALRRILKQTKRELGLPVDDDDDDDTTAGPSKSITTEDAPDDDDDDVDVAPPTAGPSKRFEPTEDTPDDPPEVGY